VPPAPKGFNNVRAFINYMEQVTDLFNLKIYFFILFNSKLGILCFMTYNINNLTMKKEEISKFYSDNEKRYRYFSQEVESLLKNLFSNNSIEYDHMEKRVKDIDRVIDKIYRKNYSDPFTEMTDIIGHRIVVHDKNDVQIIRELISEEFNITDVVDKATELDSDKFGYSDLHLIVKLHDNRINLTENIEYKDLQAEIQIRTILQHAWDKLSREIEYNSNIESPFFLRRKIARLSALMEIADDEFINIKKSKDEIKKDYKNDIDSKNLSFPINYESLSIYFTKVFNLESLIDKINKELEKYKAKLHSYYHIDTHYFNSFLILLIKANFKTLNDLDKWIKKLEADMLILQKLPSFIMDRLKIGANISINMIHLLHFLMHAEYLKDEEDKVGISWIET